MRQRNKRDQLTKLLGDIGEVLPFVWSKDSRFPAPGWYAQLDVELNGTGQGLWQLENGLLYLGADVPAAAVTIAKIHG